MPISAIEMYMLKLAKHQATMRLMLGEAAKLPHIEEDDRKEWVRDIEEKLNDGKRVERVVPPAILKMVGIGIREK